MALKNAIVLLSVVGAHAKTKTKTTDLGTFVYDSATDKPSAGASLGNVGYTTATGTDVYSSKAHTTGENIYGPFEAGFSSSQTASFTSFGCSSANAAKATFDAGFDTDTVAQYVSYVCGVTLPQITTSTKGGKTTTTYSDLLDSCGGHTTTYHFHQRLSCLYSAASGSGHSAQVGVTTDGLQYIYGKWEDYAAETLPTLDACGGHYGYTPDSTSTQVYHYHVQETMPFTIGCFGPNSDGTLVTQAQCSALYPKYCGVSTSYGSITTTKEGTYSYNLYCPCRYMSCAAGQYAVPGTNTCKTCSSGYYSAAGMGYCVACGTGKTSSSGATSCKASLEMASAEFKTQPAGLQTASLASVAVIGLLVAGVAVALRKKTASAAPENEPLM